MKMINLKDKSESSNSRNAQSGRDLVFHSMPQSLPTSVPRPVTDQGNILRQVASYTYSLTEYPYINYNRKRKWCLLLALGEMIIAATTLYQSVGLVDESTNEVELHLRHFHKRRTKPTPMVVILCIVILAMATIQMMMGVILLLATCRADLEKTMSHCQFWMWANFLQTVYCFVLIVAKFASPLNNIWPSYFILVTIWPAGIFRILAFFIVRRFMTDIRQYFKERKMVGDIEKQISAQTGQDAKEFSKRLIDTMPHLKRPAICDEDEQLRLNPAAEGTIDGVPFLF